MEHAFWRERWREGRIGFHRPDPNPHLVAHAAHLGEGTRVFVPLSGKSVDLAWLCMRGHAVVGAELVESAVASFFEEAGMSPARTVDGPFVRYECESIEIHVGDYFELDPGALGPFDAAFDRASMIALPPAMRARYVEKLRTLLAPRATVLLVTLETDDDAGPPFSVSEREVREAYAGAEIEKLGAVNALDPGGPLEKRGVRRAEEHVYRIRLGG